MTKLFIQIPAYNEEKTLSQTIKDLPKNLPGISEIKILVINDGSTDKTSDVAKKSGADYVIEHNRNFGLAKSFLSGIEFCLNNGADIIVNTDGDNQYKAAYIKDLINPIQNNAADMVVGARPIGTIKHFSFVKKILQKLGSAVVRALSKTNIQDATSGFRAYNSEAAKKLNIFNDYTYTLESIIQLGLENLRVLSVPVEVNDKTRESRLIKSTSDYVIKSMIIILKVYLIYKPFNFLNLFSVIFFVPGLFLILRFFYYLYLGQTGYIQSLSIGLSLMLVSILIFMISLVSSMIAINRKLLEKIKESIKKN